MASLHVDLRLRLRLRLRVHLRLYPHLHLRLPAAEGLVKVVRVPLASLVPDPANARLHGPENLSAIVASLRRFEQVEPLIVQAGTSRIIAGNGRFAAMKELGWSECDVVQLEVDNLQATALGVALNRSAELAEWDGPVLTKLLEQLRAEDALEGVGYGSAEIDALLAEMDGAAPGPVDDQGPEDPLPKPVTELGDLWVLGNHRLLCGDSTKAEDITRLMNGSRATLLSTDPPYCVDYTGNDRPTHNGRDSGKDWTHVYREVDIEDLGQFLDGVFAATLPHVQDDAGIYIWHAHVQQPTIAAAFERHDLLLHQVIVWSKPTATFGHGYYRWKHEPCAFGWRRGHKPTHGFGQMETVWEVDWEGKARITSFHPTSKPTRLFEVPMEQHTKPGAIVLEPFNGSGSQIMAAEKIGRRCYACEITPTFVDGTVLRWQKATGREAVLEGTTKTFADVARERGAG